MGTWDLPGGFIDFEETAEQALRRELHEELNLTVDRSRYLFSIPNRYVFAGVLYRTIDLFFLCRAERLDTIVLKDGEIAACRFQRIEAIDVNDLGLESIQQGITLLQQKVADGEIWILP